MASTGGEHAAASWLAAVLQDLWAWLLMMIGGAIAWIYRAVDTHGRKLAEHEGRIAATEKQGDKIDQIAADVAHIRGRFDEQDQRRHHA